MLQSAAQIPAQPLTLPVLTRLPEAEVLASESGGVSWGMKEGEVVQVSPSERVELHICISSQESQA